MAERSTNFAAIEWQHATFRDIGCAQLTSSSAQRILLTVTIGSNGPKISSFIIVESSGTSNNMVGPILLKNSNNRCGWHFPGQLKWVKI